jgi:uncharacterized membrane protein YccC
MLSYLRRAAAVLPLPLNQGSLFYILRSLLAAALALGLGLYLQLDSPFTGASTVLLLLHPVQGAVTGKGAYRALGTLIGLFAAFVLMGLFAQKMLLLIIGMGLWLGLCTWAMTLLRHYMATAAIVAGYTVCLALGPALVEPATSFEHLMTRGTAVILGVFSISLAAILFSRTTVEGKLEAALADVARRAIESLSGRLAQTDAGVIRHDSSLTMDIGKIDDLLGLGRGESLRLESRVGAIRAGLAHVQSASIDVCLARDGDGLRHVDPAWTADLQATLERIGRQLEVEPSGFSLAAQDLGNCLSRLEQRVNGICPGLNSKRLIERVKDIYLALTSFAALEQGAPVALRKIAFHRNYPDALHNGLRAFIAYAGAGLVWYLSGWNQGPTVFAVLGPCCTLFAASAYAQSNTVSFIKGTLYAIPAAAACKFLLFPLINGFALLVLSLGVFWYFGIHATTKPQRALQGVAYLIVFNTLVSTGLTASYDFVEFANESLATVIALCMSLLAFQLLPRPRAAGMPALGEVIHQQVLRLLRDGQRLDHERWQARQQHRIVLLQSLTDSAQAERITGLACLSIQLSRELVRVRQTLADAAPGSSEFVHGSRGLQRIAASRNHLDIGAAQARRTANALRRSGAGYLADVYADVAWLLGCYDAAFRSLS